MLGTVKAIYLATRKKHDQLFNTYVMRPLAAGVVAILAPTPITPNQLTLLNLFIFVGAAVLFAVMPGYLGGVLAASVLEVSYLFDCTDGMLARHKKIASKEGHLFDFFTDEGKAVMLAGALAIRLYRGGGLGLDGTIWPAATPAFLYAGIAGTIILASGISLTNFVRRPEISGKEVTVDAFYETQAQGPKRSLVGRVAELGFTFLRFLNHYPSHIWIFALAARLDAFFWIYVTINLLNLARGWLGLIVRFGRFPKAPKAEG
jgi:phosphatidylglycerophosphate synthase